MLETEIKKLTAAIEANTIALGNLQKLGLSAPVPNEIEEPEPEPQTTVETKPEPERTEPTDNLGLPMSTASGTSPLVGETKSMLPPGQEELSEIQAHAVTRVAEISASLGRADIMQGLMGAYGITNLSETPDEVLRKFIPAAEKTFLESMEQLKAGG